jgi:cytochrome P450
METVSVAALHDDPYALFARMHRDRPTARIAALGIWYVTAYGDVRDILSDQQHFATGTDDSLIQDLFGAHMLTLDGPEQARQKAPFRGAFSPSAVRRAFTGSVTATVDRLIDGFVAAGSGDLRQIFARRLPVLTMLDLLGLPVEHEPDLRRWYDHFEAALANFERKSDVRDRAREDVAHLHDLVRARLAHVRQHPGDDLLSQAIGGAEPLSDDEIVRNISIIVFGGVSTVEALILNSLHALFSHPDILAGLRSGDIRTADVIEETLRWRSPVQSATRHVIRPVTIGGISFAVGDTVNCMIGAANRDPAVFADPARFLLDRPNISRHLAFAAGAHFCLGSHLARLEATIAIDSLLARCPDLRAIDIADTVPHGYEFHQPERMMAGWKGVVLN